MPCVRGSATNTSTIERFLTRSKQEEMGEDKENKKNAFPFDRWAAFLYPARVCIAFIHAFRYDALAALESNAPDRCCFSVAVFSLLPLLLISETAPAHAAEATIETCTRV